MEPERPQKPLSDEQIWGKPPDNDDDYLMEDVLAESDEYCSFCGEPMNLCICGEDGWGEDLYGDDLQ